MADIVVRSLETEDELAQAIALRHDVFITEEGRDRTIETDDIDKSCHHIVAVENGTVLGTLRLYLQFPGDTDIKVGRVAVRKDRRGEGIGAKMMEAAREWAIGKYPSIYLYSHVKVVGFYEKLGYTTEGEVFQESGAPHISMRRTP